MLTRTLRALTCLCAASLILVGCSGDDANRTTAPDSPAAAPAEMLGSPANLRHQSHPLGDLVQWDVPADATSDDVVSYRVYHYAPNPSQTEAYVLMGSVDRARLILDTLAPGQEYVIRVRGVNADGIEGDWSDDIQFIALGPVTTNEGGPRPGIETTDPTPHDPIGNTY